MLANEKYYWECMIKGDKNAFLNIYQYYYSHLFRYGFSLTLDKELTKDSIQELFLEIWNTKTSLNKEVRNIRSYLFTWLRRKISLTLSRFAREKRVEDGREIYNYSESSYEDLLIAFQSTEEKKVRLARAISNLTKKQIEIIRLKFFENLTYEQIADKTSLSTRTIYNVIYEAIHHLREDVSLLV